MRSGSDDGATREQRDLRMRAKPQENSAMGAEHQPLTHGNAWNDFQRHYSGRGWGAEKMRAEYWKMKATGQWPK